MKAVIVGCGRIAGGYNTSDESQVLSHVVAYRRAGIDVAGCVDCDEARARQFATRWGITFSGTNLADMLRQTGASLVSDCTPPEGRLVTLTVSLAAPSVRTILAEKPFGFDEITAVKLASLSSASGKRVLVNHHRAYDPCYLECERRVRVGMLGSIQWLVGHSYGGALNSLSHLLERAIAMMGSVVEARIMATTAGDPGDPGIALAAEFQGGGRGMFLPLTREGFAGVELDLLGTDGRLRIVDSERRVDYFRNQKGIEPGCESLQLLVAEAADMPPPDWQALRHVVAAAASDDLLAIGPPARAAEVVAVIDRVRRRGHYHSQTSQIANTRQASSSGIT